MEYMARLIDSEIERFLKIMGAILLVGPNGVVKPPPQHNFQIVY